MGRTVASGSSPSERGSILVTTNLPFDEWTEVFGSERLTGALLTDWPITFTSWR